MIHWALSHGLTSAHNLKTFTHVIHISKTYFLFEFFVVMCWYYFCVCFVLLFTSILQMDTKTIRNQHYNKAYNNYCNLPGSCCGFKSLFIKEITLTQQIWMQVQSDRKHELSPPKDIKIKPKVIKLFVRMWHVESQSFTQVYISRESRKIVTSLWKWTFKKAKIINKQWERLIVWPDPEDYGTKNVWF